MKSNRLLRVVAMGMLAATVTTIAPTTANAVWKQNSTGGGTLKEIHGLLAGEI